MYTRFSMMIQVLSGSTPRDIGSISFFKDNRVWIEQVWFGIDVIGNRFAWTGRYHSQRADTS